MNKLEFPTMLRKMWSGGEVQKWLDENHNNVQTNEEYEKIIHKLTCRFLAYKFPSDFNPDGGIEFNPPIPKNPDVYGTNLFNYEQAKEMVLFMFAEDENNE